MQGPENRTVNPNTGITSRVGIGVCLFTKCHHGAIPLWLLGAQSFLKQALFSLSAISLEQNMRFICVKEVNSGPGPVSGPLGWSQSSPLALQHVPLKGNPKNELSGHTWRGCCLQPTTVLEEFPVALYIGLISVFFCSQQFSGQLTPSTVIISRFQTAIHGASTPEHLSQWMKALLLCFLQASQTEVHKLLNQSQPRDKKSRGTKFQELKGLSSGGYAPEGRAHTGFRSKVRGQELYLPLIPVHKARCT